MLSADQMSRLYRSQQKFREFFWQYTGQSIAKASELEKPNVLQPHEPGVTVVANGKYGLNSDAEFVYLYSPLSGITYR